MDSTSVSLLNRLRENAAEEDWERFVLLYTPLLFYWAGRITPQQHDAADLVQDAFLHLRRELPKFQYDADKSFRGWLRTVLLNKWRETRRRRGIPLEPAGEAALSGLQSPDNITLLEEAEHKQHIVTRLLKLMQNDFQSGTWRACWECTAQGRSAADVAKELGMTVGAVRSANFRVLTRLRQELNGMLD